MTSPLPKTPKQREAHKAEHSANTYHRQVMLDSNNVKGRFESEEASTVVGAYPRAASGPWSASGPRPPDEPPIDGSDPAPIVGEPWEIEACQKAIARAQLDQKLAGVDNTRELDRLQRIIDRNAHAINRRL